MVIEFDGTQIDNDLITSISYDSKMLNDNDTFTLGQTVCDTLKLTIAKEDIETQPDIVTVNNKDYIVDNIEEDDTSYIYTLTDYMVNFNFRYDAQPLIEASEHTEEDGTKYVTLLELVQDICSQANLELITEDFIGNDKHITWYDNTVTAREYIGMVAELNGGYAVIDEGLVFKRITNGEIKTIIGEPNITIQDGTNTLLVGCNIEGNSYQETYKGTNLFNANVIANTSIVVSNEGQTITMPVATSGNGITATNKTLAQLCPTLKVGDVVYLRFSKTPSEYNPYIYLDSPSSYLWNESSSRTITQNDLSSAVYLYGNRYSSGQTEQVTINGFRIVKTQNEPYEKYVGGIASPNPDYLQEVEVVETYNLLNVDDITATNIASIQKNNNGFSYTRTGSASTDNFVAEITLYLKPNTTYSIYMGKNNRQSLYFYTNNLWGTNLPATAIANIAGQYCWYKFTTTDTGKAVIGFYSVNETQGTSGTISNIMVLEGNSTLNELQDFIPYNNIGVNVVGKNLIKITQNSGTFNELTFTKIDDNTFRVQGTTGANPRQIELTTMFPKLTASDDYTYSVEVISGTFVGTLPIAIRNADNTIRYNYFNLSSSRLTQTNNMITNNGIYNWVYWIAANSTVDVTLRIMFEKSSTATTYEPYSNITTPIDLQGNFIGKIGSIKDELNIDDLGNVILTKRIGKVVLNGTENITTNPNGTNSFYVPQTNILKEVNTTNVKSDYFNGIRYYDRTTGGDNTIYTENLTDNFTIRNTAFTSVNAFKTWLGTHNTTIYYVLNTPYQVNLGKANIILNNGTNYITFLTGLDSRNTIEYTSESAEYEINIEDCEDYKIGDYHKITRVAIENGIFEPVGTDEGNTLYLNANNVYITEQDDLNNIYALVKGFEYYSLEIKKGDLDIVPTGECIALVIDKPYKTYSQIEANYNGGWYGKYHFITGSNKQEETAVYNGTEDNYKRLKLQVDRDKNEIGLLAETKVDTDDYTKAEIVARINDNTSQVQIDADNIDLTGTNFNLTADNITINSTNFSVTNDGTIISKAGNIAGFNIEREGLISKYYAPYDYTETDYNRVKQIIEELLTPTQQELEKYDLNENNEIDGGDLLAIRKFILYGITTTTPLEIGIDTGRYATQGSLVVRVGEEIYSSIMLSGITTNRIVAGNIDCGVVSITPRANTPTYEHVDFNKTFTSPPIVTATAESSVIGSVVQGVSVANVTTTGCDIYIYRTNNTTTNVNWIAML